MIMPEENYLKENIKELLNRCNDKEILYLIYNLLGDNKERVV